MDKFASTGFLPDQRVLHQGEHIRRLATFNFPIGLAQKLIHLSNGSDKRLLMILIAGVESLVYRYTGEEELLIVTPVTNRGSEGKINENTVLLIQNQITSQTTWKELILAVRQCLTAAEEEQREPYVHQFQGSGQKPEEVLRVGISLVNLQIRSYLSRIPCPLIFEFQKDGEGLQGCVEYDAQLYHETTIMELVRHLQRLLEQECSQPDTAIAAVDLLTDDERDQILCGFNATAQELPPYPTLVHAFEAQVERTPDHPALTAEHVTLTYSELNAKANDMANLLQQKGVGPERIVALMVESSLETVVGTFGILKAGGAFLPIDPTYPADRIEFMLTDANVTLILTRQEYMDHLPTGYRGDMILFDQLTDAGTERTNPASRIVSANLAYTIYTSGSTGLPKGVLIEHGSAVNSITSQIQALQLTVEDRVTKYFLPIFDASILEIFLALLSGAHLISVPKEIRYDPDAIRDWIHELGITFAFFANNFAQVMVQRCPDLPLRWMMGGGDLIKMIPQTRYPFTNAYGPTECAILATTQTIAADCESILPTIGKPIANTQIYILDANQRVLPINAVGEIYIGGKGVGRGYLNRPTLTKERFLPNPFQPGERMYRTGDLGRWRPDGEIEFLGRADTQVKIHGFRIEMGEIETQLQQHPNVREVTVIAKESEDGDKYLAAYLALYRKIEACHATVDPINTTVPSDQSIADAANTTTPEELIGYLQRYLPEYMIPRAYVFLDALPRTPQGKIDYRGLPEPVRGKPSDAYVAPQNDREIRLAGIWSEILHLEKISLTDDFFQLGGHSLNIAILIAQIHREFQVELTYQDIFHTPILRNMAQLITRSEARPYESIQQQEKREYYPVSYGQKRLWFLQQMEPTSAAYNMPERIRWTNSLDLSAIRDVLAQLVARHESFRTYFTAVNGEPVQRILDAIDLTLEITDLSKVDEGVRYKEAERVFLEETLRPFQLDTPPLFRIKAVKLNDSTYDVIFTQHHIISDGWSMEILIREFFTLYHAHQRGERVELPPIRVQYKDFAVWHNQLLHDSAKMQKAKTFWAEMLADQVTGMNLPYDLTPSSVSDHRAAAYRFVLPIEVQTALKELAAKQQTSLFTLMLAAYELFLGRTSGQNEVIVGIPMAGREHEDLKQIIGFFINTTVTRLTLDPSETFLAMLGRVSGNLLQILEYQSFPLELITDELRVSYPTISVFFNMLNLGESTTEEISNLEAFHVPEVGDVKFDLVCYLKEYANGIEIRCHYRSTLFKPGTIEYLMGRYRRILEEIAADAGKPITQYGAAPQKRKLTLG